MKLNMLQKYVEQEIDKWLIFKPSSLTFDFSESDTKRDTIEVVICLNCEYNKYVPLTKIAHKLEIKGKIFEISIFFEDFCVEFNLLKDIIFELNNHIKMYMENVNQNEEVENEEQDKEYNTK